MIINETQIDNLDNQDLSLIPTKTLIRSFGRPEDNVELSVYDLNGNLLTFRENFRGYKPQDQITNKEGLYNEINIDYTQTLKTLGFTSGQYQLILGFYRKVILNSFTKLFYISEISPSRREIKIKSSILTNSEVTDGFREILSVIENGLFFREFILIFNNNTQATAINFQIDPTTDPTEVLIKLYDPLPNNLGVKSVFRIAEEIINPVSITVDLGEPTLDELIVGEEIKGPNLRIDTRLNASKPSTFRTYDQILGSSISSSFQNINNYLSSSFELAIDFSDTDTDSGYHFENFIHFSSAVERLKNFRYKIQLLESYDDEINDIDTLEGAQTSSVVVIAERDKIEKKKSNLIGTFDQYERFLYYESGTYAWPKTNSAKPYTLAPVNSSISKKWIGSEDYNSGYYGGQLLSGSEYDDINIHRLTDTLPEHIVSNNDNSQYVLFVNMVAEYFDRIWLYIDHITNINEADSKLTRGISKEMVYDVLERAGLKVFDQFENENLFSYITSEAGANGVFQYQAPAGQTMISASNAGSIPKGDITKEIWKRLYHNLPYLLKTKGTERGMKALMSCYGIPETILHVKEYGGPVVDKTGFRTFSYPKKSKMLTALDSVSPNSLFIMEDVLEELGQSTRTIQTRILPNSNDDLIPVFALYSTASSTSSLEEELITDSSDFLTTDDGDFLITDYIPSGYYNHDMMVYISRSIDSSYVGEESASFGKLVLVTGSITTDISLATQFESNAVPFFNGEVWNITLTLGSGSDLGNVANIYATNTTFNKNTFIASSSNLDFESVFSQESYKDIHLVGLPGKPDFSFNLNQSSGSALQEFRLYTELLTESTIISQSLSPFNYNGNTISSSFEHLYYRLPLGSDLSILSNPLINITTPEVNKPPSPSSFIYGSSSEELVTDGGAYLITDSDDFLITDSFTTNLGVIYPGTYINIEETHHLTTPDTVGKSMVSDKVRLDTGTIEDDILSPFIRSEESTQDRQPNDFSDLGIFFSPTFEVNEDIVYTLGGFRMDDYIGDPRHYTSSYYPDLKTLREIYVQKVSDKIVNFWDYIKLIQYFDHTLFKMVEQFAPAKANLKTGLVIEPHYLERYKTKGLYINTDSTSYELNLPGVLPPVSSEYSLHELDINVYDYIVSGSGGNLENNAINGRLSSKYYTRVKPYGQLALDTTPPINPNTGEIPPIPADR